MRRAALLLLLVGVGLGAGCGGGAKAQDGAADAPVTIDVSGLEPITLPDHRGEDGALQCCGVTVTGPGDEACPCTPYNSTSFSRACQDVGRKCAYEACSGAQSCECKVPEDGGAPVWDCAILII